MPKVASGNDKQIIPMEGPPLGELPRWGRRVEFDSFFVELVPAGVREFNVRLSETFASINFEPATGTSSLAGERLRRYDRLPYEYIVVPPRFPLRGRSEAGPEVLAFVLRLDEPHPRLLEAYEASQEELRPEVVVGSPSSFNAELAKRLRTQLSGKVIAREYVESLSIALLTEFLRPLFEKGVPRDKSPIEPRKISMLLSYIDANLESRLVLEDLSRLVGLSPHRLCRAFKSAVGESPHQYVLQRRVARARHLMQAEGCGLAEAALAAGFSSQSHMTVVFKRFLGVTPGRLRLRGGKNLQ